MGILERFTGKKPEVKKPFKRAYSAANTGRLFADYVDSQRSPDSELHPVITRLRARSRDLARNNEYARRYFNLLKTNVVGQYGFKLQVKALDPRGSLDTDANSAIEASFKRWGKRGNCTADGKMSWIDVQKMVIEGLARDGEVFIIKHRGTNFHDSFTLEFIEPDQVDEEKTERLENGAQIRMGVELDKFRKPVAYHLLTSHPGDFEFASLVKSPKHRRVPADQVIHVFMPLRPGQTRGEPWLSPAMSSIKQLDGWREASIIAARMGASKMGFFTSPAGDNFVADEMDGQVPFIDASPGTFHQLPTGVNFESFDPQYPTSEFDNFHKCVLKGVASGLGVSYTSLANDLEATSYSSIRQGALEERDFYRNIQQVMIDHFVRPVYEAWLMSAMEVETVFMPVNTYDKFITASEFRGRAWNWVDPMKEMNAAIMGMKNGVLSLQDVAAQYGKDTEELLAEIQRDRNLMEQFGIKYALEPYGSTQIGIEPDIVGDDDGEV